MRNHIMSSVSDSCAGVANLQRRKTQLALTYWQRNYRRCAPMSLAVKPVEIILWINNSVNLLRKVAAEFFTETERLNPAPPVWIRTVSPAVLSVADNSGKLVAEICIAGVFNSRNQIQRAAVVTFYDVASDAETAVAGKRSRRTDNAFMQAD